jgi:hypothetical protein
VTFKQGDIIIVRSGFTEALGEMTGEQQAEALGSHRTCGVEGSEDSAKWFWNKHFAAVAGDAIAFEAVPPIVNGKEGTVADLGKSTILSPLVIHHTNLIQSYINTSSAFSECQSANSGI